MIKSYRQAVDTVLDLLSDESAKIRRTARILLLNNESMIVTDHRLVNMSDAIDNRYFTANQPKYDEPTDNSIIQTISVLDGDSFVPVEITENKDYFTMLQAVSSTEQAPRVALLYDKEISFYPTPTGTDAISSEAQTSDSTTQVRTSYEAYSVTGVWLATDTGKTETNYYTGGSIDGKILTLGSALPGASTAVIIDYQPIGFKVNYRQKTSVADDLSGTADAGTTGTNLTADSAIFSASDVGRIAVNTTEGKEDKWAEVSALVDGSNVTLSRSGQFASTDTFVLSDKTIIPEEHIMTPVFKTALMLYGKREDSGMYSLWSNEYKEGLRMLKNDKSARSTGITINRAGPVRVRQYTLTQV